MLTKAVFLVFLLIPLFLASKKESGSQVEPNPDVKDNSKAT